MSEVWEYGSEFEWRAFGAANASTGSSPVPWADGAYTCTGRDAIRAVLRQGADRSGWKRLFAPSYLCEEVLESLRDSRLELCAYPDRPGSKLDLPSPQRPGDVLFVSNTFGLRRPVDQYDSRWTAIVEDHTHDPASPWAAGSRAHYCIASLRKSLPVPDGAVVWSPLQLPLPEVEAQDPERRACVLDKLTAMMLKGQYLAGNFSEKRLFRELAVRGEAGLASNVPMAISDLSRELLQRMPVSEWRTRRAANHGLLTTMLSGEAWFRILAAETADCCPFSLCLLTPSPGCRESLREYLIARSIYPAVLWPPVLSWGDDADREISETILSIPCDMRYGEADLVRVAGAIEEFAVRNAPLIKSP